jgi:hypothetical protein
VTWILWRLELAACRRRVRRAAYRAMLTERHPLGDVMRFRLELAQLDLRHLELNEPIR